MLLLRGCVSCCCRFQAVAVGHEVFIHAHRSLQDVLVIDTKEMTLSAREVGRPRPVRWPHVPADGGVPGSLRLEQEGMCMPPYVPWL